MRLATHAVWALSRSLATTWEIVFTFFSCGYLDVSVPRVRLRYTPDDGIPAAGLPHSDIRGSMGICPSPRLFAACHVLLRLREPRHPPCALLLPLFRFRYQVFSTVRLLLLVFYLFAIYASTPLSKGEVSAPPACQCPLSLVSSGNFTSPENRLSSVVLGRVELPTSTLSV